MPFKWDASVAALLFDLCNNQVESCRPIANILFLVTMIFLFVLSYWLVHFGLHVVRSILVAFRFSNSSRVSTQQANGVIIHDLSFLSDCL